MDINLIFPFLSTLIMLVFVIFVMQRYAATKKLHFLYWGIGLAMFGSGSFAEAYLALAWNKWVFFIWYLFGAALNAGWIGHGTLNLLFRKKWVHYVTGVLIIGSLGAAYLMLSVMPDLETANFTTSNPISEQYGTKQLERRGRNHPHHLPGRRSNGYPGYLAAGCVCQVNDALLQYLRIGYPGRRGDLVSFPVLAKAGAAKPGDRQCVDRCRGTPDRVRQHLDAAGLWAIPLPR